MGSEKLTIAITKTIMHANANKIPTIGVKTFISFSLSDIRHRVDLRHYRNFSTLTLNAFASRHTVAHVGVRFPASRAYTAERERPAAVAKADTDSPRARRSERRRLGKLLLIFIYRNSVQELRVLRADRQDRDQLPLSVCLFLLRTAFPLLQ